MKRFRVFILVLAGIAILGTIAFKYKELAFPNRQTGANNAADMVLTGILREMDIGEETKTNRFVSEGRFLLAQLNTDDKNKLPYDGSILFIEKYPSDPAELVGKCVTVKGKLDSDWINKTIERDYKYKRFIYNGLVFLADEIGKNDYGKCEGYTSSDEVPEGSKLITVSGTLQRFPRVVPDIELYDYTLKFSEPYISEVNASGIPQERDSMSISPQNNDIWIKLENKVDKPIAIEGYELWGYSESKYILVTKVKE